ncbi:MAG TPA: methyltransferase domain-containing protein, partial [Solirubrobacterales bacterium]
MDSPRSSAEEAAPGAAAAPPPYFEARAELAYRFLAGAGLEIGALNWPLQVPSWAVVKNVDRMTPEQLREAYPEMAELELAEVDLIDDGERLESIADDSQDFIIANHFLEHTGDPIGTIANHLAKLKSGGVLFYAVPDKRYTFDFRRESTPLEHIVRDHEQGPAASRRGHFDEWGRLVVGTEADREDPAWPERAEEVARELEAEDFSIHTHSWTDATFLELLLHCRCSFDEAFEIEVAARRELEIVVILRKAGADPAPAAPAQTTPELAAEAEELRAQVARLGRELAQTGRELRQIQQSSSWRVTEPLRAAKAR